MNGSITAQDVSAALRGLGVRQSDTLFVHSDVRRCLRMVGATRAEKLETVTAGLAGSVNAGTLILPTFTYSFCRDEPFDPRRSASTVGVLTEHFRAAPGVRRTMDPIFSSAILGPVAASWEQLFAVGDCNCFGDRSVFAYLLDADAKLLFLDVGLAACTFMMHVEQREHVAYRYFKDFSGLIEHDSGVTPVTARYFVRDLDDDVEAFLEPLMDDLRDAGEAHETRIERGPALIVCSARALAARAVAGLRENPDYLLERGHAAVARSPDA